MAGMRDINQDVYHDKLWRWQEGEYTVTRTTQWSAPGCHEGCGVLFYTKDGKLEKVEGDPNNPINNGRLCARCIDLLEAVYNKDRVLYPLKRAGEHGENKWERISWDEAYEIIETKSREIIEKYGPRSVCVFSGTGRNATWSTPAIGQQIFGTPNTGLGGQSGESCYAPRMTIMNMVLGAAFVADMGQALEKRFDDPRYVVPGLIVVWGNNPLASNSDGFYGHWVVDCMRRGSKLITVDPRITWLAAKSEIALQVRPGTDGALALGMLNVITNEGLQDQEFVDAWCYGYDEMCAAAAPYTPEVVSEITGIEEELIVAAARMMGTIKPMAVQWGVALDMQTFGMAASFAILDMIAITGNLDKPGSNIIFDSGYVQADIRAAITQMAGKVLMKDQIGNNDERWPLRLAGLTHGLLPDAVLEQLQSDTPDVPLRMFWFESSNPLACVAQDALAFYEGYAKNSEFTVVADPFLTPTAVALADIVLPIAMSPERDSMRAWWAPFRAITKVIEPEGEAKDDETLMLELGKRMTPEKFPWANTDEMREYFMENVKSVSYRGSYRQLQKDVWHYTDFQYEKYKIGALRSDGQPGFNTHTGRFELYSTFMDSAGHNPVPYYQEPLESPVSRPDLAEKYPFVLTTGQRSWFYFHSENRQMPLMREFHPWPLCCMNPEDAKALGLREGEWVYIENSHGKCKQKLILSEGMKKGVVNAEHGWWFPEQGASAEDGFYGTFECNSNLLIPMGQVGPEGFAAPLKSGLCTVYKCDDPTPEDRKEN